MKYRKQAEGGKNTAYLRNLLLKPGYQVLDYWRPRLAEWLKKHPQLEEVYWAKERLSRFYRIRSVAQAAKELTRLTDSLCLSRIPELRTVRDAQEVALGHPRTGVDGVQPAGRSPRRSTSPPKAGARRARESTTGPAARPTPASRASTPRPSSSNDEPTATFLSVTTDSDS